jgi:hypothetical protein
MGDKVTMQGLWKRYTAEVLPRDAPQVQIDECRQAFYAGAFGLFNGIMHALDPGPDATDADVEFMERIQLEFQQYAIEVGLRAARREDS